MGIIHKITSKILSKLSLGKVYGYTCGNTCDHCFEIGEMAGCKSGDRGYKPKYRKIHNKINIMLNNFNNITGETVIGYRVKDTLFGLRYQLFNPESTTPYTNNKYYSIKKVVTILQALFDFYNTVWGKSGDQLAIMQIRKLVTTNFYGELLQ